MTKLNSDFKSTLLDITDYDSLSIPFVYSDNTFEAVNLGYLKVNLNLVDADKVEDDCGQITKMRWNTVEITISSDVFADDEDEDTLNYDGDMINAAIEDWVEEAIGLEAQRVEDWRICGDGSNVIAEFKINKTISVSTGSAALGGSGDPIRTF